MQTVRRGQFGAQATDLPGLYAMDLVDCEDGSRARVMLEDEDLDFVIDTLVSLRTQRASFLGEEEVARIAHVRAHVVACWLDARKIPFVRQGGRRLVRRRDLLLYLARRQAERMPVGEAP